MTPAVNGETLSGCPLVAGSWRGDGLRIRAADTHSSEERGKCYPVIRPPDSSDVYSFYLNIEI